MPLHVIFPQLGADYKFPHTIYDTDTLNDIMIRVPADLLTIFPTLYTIYTHNTGQISKCMEKLSGGFR